MVVGYQEITAPAGSSMKTATFKAINGSYKISDIKVAGIAGGGADLFQKLNADGTWGDAYYYLTMDGTGYVEDGWYKDDFGGVPVTDEDVIGIGESLIVTAANEFTFTFSGEVIPGNATVHVPAGASIIGNPTPASAKIADLVVIGAAGGGADLAQKLNADGTWGDAYYYLTMDGTGYVEDGWYKDDFGGVPVTDEDVLEAGESMIFTAVQDMTIKFPAVL